MARLSEGEVQERLSALPEWRLEDGAIVRDLQLEDFAAGLELVARVGALAEAANHHPDILLHGWNKLRQTLMTHSEGGLTESDFRLAGQIDALA
jgi:4a-hydroxytetrahydrobiopterin dehydratase